MRYNSIKIPSIDEIKNIVPDEKNDDLGGEPACRLRNHTR
jgi:hypothetical protein